MKFDVNHKSRIEYERASYALKDHYKNNIVDIALHMRYRKAIANYRRYLDSVHYEMPKAIYPYNPDDRRTWFYLGFDVKMLDVGSNEKKIQKFVYHYNPYWCYKKQDNY